MKKPNLGQRIQTTFSWRAGGLIVFLLSASIGLTQDVWTGAGPDGFWTTNSNWSTPPPPAGLQDLIMVGPGHLVNTANTTLFGSAPREWRLHSILFPDGAPNFLIHLNVVTIEATATPGGIFNSSGKLQILDMDPGNVFTNTTAGALTLQSATIGSGVLLENKGGTTANPEPGVTSFFGASAGLATINNFGGSDIRFETGGRTVVGAGATAGNASIANLGGDSTQGSGGSTLFQDDATGGNASIHNLGATAADAAGGETRFSGISARAGNATITNDGSNASGSSVGARTIFTISASADHATITNHAGVVQGGETAFALNAGAGNALIINEGAGFIGQAGHTDFNDSSTAAAAIIVNAGGAPAGPGGITSFNGTSDAGNATLIAQAGAPPTNTGIPIPGGQGGAILFNGNSTGGTADVQVLGNGRVDISGHAAPGVTIGTIEGDGQAYLGANNLSVGSSNNTVIFYGSLHDGGNSGGTGGSFTKVGSGSFTLAGTSDYTGATTVAAGALLVDGNIAHSSGVTVNSGATLGGHGIIGSVGGAGTVAPGNSPGILTATQVNPTGGLDFAFQMTKVGSPIYGNAAASGNDLLHLTGLVPFTAPLSAANQITLDFSGALLSSGQIYLGGFFTDAAIDAAMVNNATFLYLGLNGFDVQFDGFVTEPVADFADRTVLNGELMKFEIGSGTTPVTGVPEPSTYGLLSAIGLAALAFKRRQSRR